MRCITDGSVLMDGDLIMAVMESTALFGLITTGSLFLFKLNLERGMPGKL